MKIVKDDPCRDTRHRVDVVINEEINMTLPDENGVLVSVEHNCAILTEKGDEDGAEKRTTEDLVDILVNLIVGAIVNSDYDPSYKFLSAFKVGKAIIMSVGNAVRPREDSIEEMKEDLTEEQQAALELSMSAHTFRPPVS